MNLVLIGYRCSGKTSVGKILAKELSKNFFDIDQLIEENVGNSIDKIVFENGWEYFRELEKETIAAISREDMLVIATGGGIVLESKNIKNLKENGFLIWLKGSVEAIRIRMERDLRLGKIRPSLTENDPIEEIEFVMQSRNHLYEQAADFAVDTSTLNRWQVAELIIKALPKRLYG